MRPPSKSALALFLALSPAAASAAQDFGKWREAFKKEALTKGISQKTLSLLDAVEPDAKVIELDRRQPEGTMTFEAYRDRVVTAERIADGRRLFQEHQALLSEVTSRYGVDPNFVVALWGVETHFGKIKGDFSIVGALATLAADGRRPTLFRSQLLGALKILDRGDVSFDQMKGSWAGAMGHCQFMPTTYLAYAVDHDGDGKRDLWNTLPDVFASAANYLKKSGWKRDAGWGARVILPAKFNAKLLGRSTKKSIAQWQKLGVTLADGGKLPPLKGRVSIVKPGGSSEEAYLVHSNYHVLLRWNRSEYFATVVSLLADAIAAPSQVSEK